MNIGLKKPFRKKGAFPTPSFVSVSCYE
jgi:hypothetical protein